MSATPSIHALDAHLRAATRAVAERLREGGHQAWLVGGAVRDLALGRAPKDIDLATDALPDQIEALFPRTIAVGKAFGTIVVVEGDFETQVTTFRTERGHHDGRRPTEVAFGRDLSEDAARRDFTCNALYLDPLEDRLVDPFGGLADLRAKLLRTVGDARERFAEDGLRLVRMARIAAANALEVESATLAAASASAAALRGVSAERRLAELTLIFERSGGSRAFHWLEKARVLDTLCPGFDELELGAPDSHDRRWAAIDALGQAPGVELGFSVLFDATKGATTNEPPPVGRGARLLEALKPSRALSAAVLGTWRACQQFRALDASSPRSAKLRLARDPVWPRAARVLSAWRTGASGLEVQAFAAWAADRTNAELHPAAWITSSDLAAAGVAPGPQWKLWLEQAETMQLDGVLATRERALEWLTEQIRALRTTGGTSGR